jgi:hypothetical protein
VLNNDGTLFDFQEVRRESAGETATVFTIEDISYNQTYHFLLLMGHWEHDGNFNYYDGVEIQGDSRPPTLLAAGLTSKTIEGSGTVRITMWPIMVDTKFVSGSQTRRPVADYLIVAGGGGAGGLLYDDTGQTLMLESGSVTVTVTGGGGTSSTLGGNGGSGGGNGSHRTNSTEALTTSAGQENTTASGLGAPGDDYENSGVLRNSGGAAGGHPAYSGKLNVTLTQQKRRASRGAAFLSMRNRSSHLR